MVFSNRSPGSTSKALVPLHRHHRPDRPSFLGHPVRLAILGVKQKAELIPCFLGREFLHVLTKAILGGLSRFPTMAIPTPWYSYQSEEFTPFARDATRQWLLPDLFPLQRFLFLSGGVNLPQHKNASLLNPLGRVNLQFRRTCTVFCFAVASACASLHAANCLARAVKGVTVMRKSGLTILLAGLLVGTVTLWGQGQGGNTGGNTAETPAATPAETPAETRGPKPKPTAPIRIKPTGAIRSTKIRSALSSSSARCTCTGAW